MGHLSRIAVVLASLFVLTAAPRAQQPASGGGAVSMDQFIERLMTAEAALMDRLGNYHPVVEIYLQSLLPDPQIGAVPTRDDYFLGQFDGRDGPTATPLSPARGWFRPAGLMNRPFGFDYVPSGFAATTVPDLRVFDRERYEFKFVRREFLDEVRCAVFEVWPKNRDAIGFKGRIWVEDRDFTIVRFNGISREADGALSRFFRRKLSFHLDSWRVNVQPGVWLPGYVYFEETDFESRKPMPRQVPKLRGQMRLWGYELTDATAPSAFSAIEIGAGIRDSSEPVRQISPVLSQRSWERQAEDNVLERLTNAGLLAPPGPVNAVLETVLNNLQITNELAYDPPLRARVLLTTPLESFLVGRTVVLSRGLIDVLPDEASLAMVLAHELSHVALGHLLIDTKFAFADRLMIPDSEVLSLLRLQRTPQEEMDADAKTIELLGRSPYQDKLANAGLFLQAVVAHAKPLKNLIQPHTGDYVVDGEHALAALIQNAPTLEPAKLDQVAVLPLGARLVLDPWSNRLDLIRTPAVPLSWAREKLPLAITPMTPVLRYADHGASAPAATE
ncbi:MAG: M48 family metalloprotease [Acidobacteria bacterium]|nr:M48 family metalloprotease [Acidobacteriota bacterium]